MAATAKVIGRNIRDARGQRRWTQKHLAERVGVESQTISNLERGLYPPSWKTLRALASELGLTEEELLAENGVVA